MRVPREDGEFHLKGDDEMVNDAEVADEMKFEELCASGDCSSMPAKQKMQIKVNICVIYIKNLKTCSSPDCQNNFVTKLAQF